MKKNLFMPTIDIITIGLPFCAFKILTGMFFNHSWLIALGGVGFADQSD